MTRDAQQAVLKYVRAGVLDVAYLESGPSDATTVVLLHGFPYDVHAYDDVTPLLTARGCRVLVPYLRGFGPTRFVAADTPRSGEQAALGNDLLQFMDALGIASAVLGGYDWGGRAACVVAALWPERARGLVSGVGYNIQHIASAGLPQSPENEHRHWYQYYFHGARGRAGLEQNRRALARLLWRLWSPHWAFDDAAFERSAASFDNPDFVDVVIHSYRHRHALVPGDPALQDIERRLAAQPVITVPSISIDGDADGVAPDGGSSAHRQRFGVRYERRVLSRVGHNMPQEAPAEFADAILALV